MSTTHRAGGVTRNQTRPTLKYTPYVAPHRRVGGVCGRGLIDSRNQYCFQPTYGGVGDCGGDSRTGTGLGGRGGRTEMQLWLPHRESVRQKVEKLKLSGPSDGSINIEGSGEDFPVKACGEDIPAKACGEDLPMAAASGEDIPVEARGENVPAPASNFQEIDFGKRLNKNIKLCGYVMPTLIQRYAIPIGMAGRDLLACDLTGSGKTAAICLPIISGVSLTKNPGAGDSDSDGDGDETAFQDTAFPFALILSATGKLAHEIALETEKLAYRTGAKVALVSGGAHTAQQLYQLERGVDILVTTPGILVKLLKRSLVSFKMIKYLALDETDRMLVMGFGSHIREIVQMDMPGARQTLLFSATLSVELLRLAADLLKNYIFLTVGRVELRSNTDLRKQKVESVREKDKPHHLLDLLKNQRDNGTYGKLPLTLVFVETQKVANQLENWLSRNGFPVIAIHGDEVQTIEQALKLIHRASILVTTDAASRGLCIPNVDHVINFDFPESIYDYIHRIGSTGPAGKSGLATAFFSEKNKPLAKALVELLNISKQEVPDWLNDYAECSVQYSRNRSQRYRSSNLGGYDFCSSDNHYGSGSHGSGDSGAAVVAAAGSGSSGSGRNYENSCVDDPSASNNGGETDSAEDLLSIIGKAKINDAGETYYRVGDYVMVDSKPENFSIQDYEDGCPICYDPDHENMTCPWLDRVPEGKTVGRIYDISCRSCGQIGKECCSVGVRPIVRTCYLCLAFGHWMDQCPRYLRKPVSQFPNYP